VEECIPGPAGLMVNQQCRPRLAGGHVSAHSVDGFIEHFAIHHRRGLAAVFFRDINRISSDFRIEVGEYPATVGVPVAIKSPNGIVAATADKLSGWPKLLPEGAAIEIAGDSSAKGKIGQPFSFTLDKETHLVITGPAVALPPEAGGGKVPFRAELTLTPQAKGLPVELTVLRGTTPYTYKPEPRP
jgi:hypothetical protein